MIFLVKDWTLYTHYMKFFYPIKRFVYSIFQPIQTCIHKEVEFLICKNHVYTNYQDVQLNFITINFHISC